MTGTLRALHLGGIAALALVTAGCGDDKPELKSQDPGAFSLFSPISAEQWPGGFPQGLDEIAPEFSEADYFGSALPQAVPMVNPVRGSARRSYAGYDDRDYGGDYAEYGYAPDYYDDFPVDQPVYYDSDPGDNSYAWLALASALGGVFGDAPPDYYFDYDDGVEPWVWETGDHFVRYAEPIDDGYRYYYYSPGRSYPFLVRDPQYSYGYYDNRVAVIYDNDGRVLDSRRSWRQRQAAERYYARARDLNQAARLRTRRGVEAPLWTARQATIAREQSQWDRARDQRQGWRDWDQRNARTIAPRWNRERVARQYATQRFDSWRDDGFRSAAPQFYREAERTPRMQQVVQQQREHRRAIVAQRREERRGFVQQQREGRVQQTAFRDASRAERQQRFVMERAQQARPDVARFRQDRMQAERQRFGGAQPRARQEAINRARAQRFQDQSRARQEERLRSQRSQSQFQARQEARNQRAQLTQARQQASVQRSQQVSQARQQAGIQRSQEMSQAREQARAQQSQAMSQARQQARIQRSQEMSQARQQARAQQSQAMSQARQQARIQRSQEMSQARQQARAQQSQAMSQARQQARAQRSQEMSQARQQARAQQSQPRQEFRAQQQVSRQEFRAQRSQGGGDRQRGGGNDRRMH